LKQSDQIDMPELYRREIDGHFQIRPALGFLERALEYEGAECGHEPGLLRHRYENRGRNVALGRVLPAQQRFDAGDAAIYATDERLVIEIERSPLDRGMQIDFNLAALFDFLGHFGAEEHRAIAAVVLALIERDVGVAHKFLWRHAVIWRHG